MAFTAKDVLSRCAIILNDETSARWPLAELLGWLNDGVREISLQKPSAATETAQIDMTAGTKQALPGQYHSLVSVIRNVASGMAITPASRDLIDRQIPGWHDARIVRPCKDVVHIIDDNTEPQTFYVVPGNDGTGRIEVVAARNVAPIVVPQQPEIIVSYSATVELNDIWQNALVDYILYRALSKDIAIPGVGDRAVAHYQQFAAAVGIKAQGEVALNVNTTTGGASAASR